jgi:type I restriction enzyme S subunit
MNRYLEYAPTTIAWEKEKPAHWKCDKAKRFFSNPKVLNKGNTEKNVLSLTLRGVIRNDVDNPIGLSPADYSTYQIFDKDELVFKLIDLENISTSRVGIVSERGIMSSAYIRLKPSIELNLRYFYYQYYDWYKRNIFNGLGGGVRQTLSAADLIELSILFPPKEEQDKIVAFLDWETEKVNRFIASKKKEIRALQELKKSLVSKALAGNNSSVEHVKTKAAYIDSAPKGWKDYRLKYLFTEINVRSEKGLETHLSMSQKKGLIPDSDLDERRMLSESYAGAKVCQKNDLVLNRLKAHLGVFALAPMEGVISPDYTVLRFDESKILPKYAELLLTSQLFRKELVIRVRGITEGFWRLYTEDLGDIYVNIPTVTEQEKICAEIKKTEDKINTLIKSLESEIDYVKEFRVRTISDVVTGKVDVRDVEIPEYEIEASETDNALEDEDSDEEETIDEEVDE